MPIDYICKIICINALIKGTDKFLCLIMALLCFKPGGTCCTPMSQVKVMGQTGQKRQTDGQVDGETLPYIISLLNKVTWSIIITTQAM